MDGNNMPSLPNISQLSSSDLELFLKFREMAAVPSVINASSSGGSNEGTSITEESGIFSALNTDKNNSSERETVKENKNKDHKEEMADQLKKQDDCYEDALGLDPTKYPDMRDRIKNAIRDRIWKQLKVLTDSKACFQKPDFVRCNFPNDEGEYNECPQAVFMVEEIFDAMGSDWDKSDLEKKIKFWITYGSFIKYEFGRYRNGRIGVMKKAFWDATKAWEEHSSGYDMNYFKSNIESFLEKDKRITFRDSLRSSINTAEKEISVTSTFFDLFLSNVVGKAYYNSKIAKKKISDFTTVSDEAFALVILESYYSLWYQEYHNGKASVKNLFPKFSARDPSVRQQEGGDKRNGWGVAMVNVFNEYHKYILVMRQEDGNKEFEVKFQEDKAVNTEVKVRRKRSVIRPEPILKVEGVLKRQRVSHVFHI